MGNTVHNKMLSGITRDRGHEEDNIIVREHRIPQYPRLTDRS